MEYKCQTVSMSQLHVTSNGFYMPLCEMCETKDCTNPIEKKEVSVMGVSRNIKTFSRGVEPRFVIQCEGFAR